MRILEAIVFAGLSVLVLTSIPGCSGANQPDPVVVGSQLGGLACAAAVMEKPEIKPALTEAVTKVLAALDTPAPTQALVNEAIAKITDPKAKFYTLAVVNSAFVLFPNLNDTSQLPPEAVAAVTAALIACQTALV